MKRWDGMKEIWAPSPYKDRLPSYGDSHFEDKTVMRSSYLEHGPLTRCVKLWFAYARRECREHFPNRWLQRKTLVSDPGMHHGTCVTHMPWCMSGSLTRGGGKTFPAFPAHAQPAISRIEQEVHGDPYSGKTTPLYWDAPASLTRRMEGVCNHEQHSA